MMDKATEAKAALAYSEWLAGYEYKAGENAEVSAFYAGYAAALEEAGADTRRLDWLSKRTAFRLALVSGMRVTLRTWETGDREAKSIRDVIDAAMTPPADSAGEGSEGGD